jgi:ureidoacrylate peracid hydrolase
MPRLLAGARQMGIPVIFVASEYSSPGDRYLSETFLAQARRRWNGRYVALPVCQRGTWGIDFFEDIRPAPGEMVVWKHRFDAFIETDLDLVLRSRQVRALVVAGVTTEVCVESTVRHAFFRDYACLVPRDAVAAYDEEMHDRSLRLMDRFFARVVDAAEVLEAWATAAASPAGGRG